MSMEPQVHEIDIVIPTRDRPEQLIVTLNALRRQTFKDFRVIIVDDGSRCDVQAEIPKRIRESLGIRFVRNDVSLGAGPARNRGVAVSRARYLIFIDDDCIASPELVARHYAALKAGGSGVSLGPLLSDTEHRLPAWIQWDVSKADEGARRLATGEDAPTWRYLFTGNVGMRRTDFLAVGGFDEGFSRGEDVELGYRLERHGCRFTFDSKASVLHDNRRPLKSWMRIAAAQAVCDAEMHERYPDLDRLAKLRASHWAIRLSRRMFGGPIAARVVIVAAIGAGIVLHAVRLDRLALPAFSLVFSLIYWRALQVQLSSEAGNPENKMEGVG